MTPSWRSKLKQISGRGQHFVITNYLDEYVSPLYPILIISTHSIREIFLSQVSCHLSSRAKQISIMRLFTPLFALQRPVFPFLLTHAHESALGYLVDKLYAEILPEMSGPISCKSGTWLTPPLAMSRHQGCMEADA
jgi:hypothetical protein